jgi:transposase InsO family protein
MYPVCELPVVPPGATWVGDFCGPFPESNRHKYILVFIDSASLWSELCAVPYTSAETILQTLFDCVISRYGWPKEKALKTDNGSGFIPKLTKLFCKTFSVRQNFSTAYHHNPNQKSKLSRTRFINHYEYHAPNTPSGRCI